jgi:hypothetical protein
MKLVNAFETLIFAYEKGNNKDYGKVLLTLRLNIKDQSFTFISDDLDHLTEYLKRTYRKISYSQKELPVSQMVKSILESEETLKSYLTYNDYLYTDFLKIFLLFASTDAEYRKLAKILIEKQVDPIRLAQLNSPAHDGLILDLISLISAMNSNGKERKELLVAFGNRLKEEYADLQKRCTNSIINRISMRTNFEDHLESLNYIMQSLMDADEETIEEEGAIFNQQVVKTAIVMEIKQQAEVKPARILNPDFENELVVEKVELVEKPLIQSKKTELLQRKPLRNAVSMRNGVDVSSIYANRSEQIHQELVNKLTNLKLNPTSGRFMRHKELPLVVQELDDEENIDSIVSDIQSINRSQNSNEKSTKKRHKGSSTSKKILL